MTRQPPVSRAAAGRNGCHMCPVACLPLKLCGQLLPEQQQVQEAAAKTLGLTLHVLLVIHDGQLQR